jgi:acyl-coenzyme A thioesterase PaaI-like protein
MSGATVTAEAPRAMAGVERPRARIGAVSVLADQTVLARTGPGTYERETDRTWWGHESLFGGYGLALAAAAIEQEASAGGDGPARTIRAITMHFLRPFVPGPFRAEVAIERTGRTVTTATARLSCNGKLCGIATATLAGERPSPAFTDLVMPDVAPIGDEPPSSAPPFVPAHAHFDFWPRFTSRRTAPGPLLVGGWILPKAPEPLTPGLLCAYGDIWVPAVYHRLERPIAAMSSDFTCHVRMPLPDPATSRPVEPVLCVLRTAAAGHGFVDEDTEIWLADGALVAQTRQLRVLQEVPQSPQ